MKKNVLSLVSSRTFSNAFDECVFKNSALSIKTILMFAENVDLFKNFKMFLTFSILIFSPIGSFSSKEKFGCVKLHKFL